MANVLGMINCLLFTDNQVIIAKDKNDIYYMLRKFSDKYDQWSLTINEQKTKYIVIGVRRNS